MLLETFDQSFPDVVLHASQVHGRDRQLVLEITAVTSWTKGGTVNKVRGSEAQEAGYHPVIVAGLAVGSLLIS
jgi:hypothetical protein